MAMLCAEIIPPIKQSQSKNPRIQRAVFRKNILWDVGDTIKVYFIEPIPTPVQDDEEAKTIVFENGERKAMWDKTKIPWKPEKTSTFRSLEDKFKDPFYNELQWNTDPKTLVIRILKERFEPLVNIKFEIVDDFTKSDVRIKFDSSGGCHSIVGVANRDEAKYENLKSGRVPIPTMYYGWLDVATVIHEFCHVLGMIHEHQNPFENKIDWNEDAVYCYYMSINNWSRETVKRNVIDRLNSAEVNGSNFDQASMMIYSFPAEVECNGKKVPLTVDREQVNPTYKFSNGDIQWLQWMYPFSGKRDPNLENYPKTVPFTELYDPEALKAKLLVLWLYIKENYVVSSVVLIVIVFILVAIFYKPSPAINPSY